MFAYKSYLKLGMVDALSPGGNLSTQSVELSKCSYSFAKEIDVKGEPHSMAMGGLIELEFTCLPSNPILEWAINKRKYEDGAIVITDNEGASLERIFFTSAACVSLSISYIQTGEAYVSTSLVLSAKTLKVGTNTLDNRWVNIK